LKQEAVPAGGPLVQALDPNAVSTIPETAPVAIDSSEPAVQEDSD